MSSIGSDARGRAGQKAAGSRAITEWSEEQHMGMFYEGVQAGNTWGRRPLGWSGLSNATEAATGAAGTEHWTSCARPHQQQAGAHWSGWCQQHMGAEEKGTQHGGAWRGAGRGRGSAHLRVKPTAEE